MYIPLDILSRLLYNDRGVVDVLLCRVCGREIDKGTIYVVKHVTVSGREGWLPVHMRCNLALMTGRAKLRGSALPSPPGHAIGDGLMLPVTVR